MTELLIGTNCNTNILRNSILAKLQERPFRWSQTNILTQPERAFFPYSKWFRGEYMSDTPIIAEREAGFRPRESRKPFWKPSTGHAYPQHCFRPGLRTHTPCYPDCTEPYKKYDSTLQRNAKIFLYR